MIKERENSKSGDPWPEDYQCAVVLSFDFDAESDELRTAPDKVVPLTKGKYGATLGLDRIFRTVEGSSLPATFFVPGWVAENYPERTKEIERRGFEIGGHGYLHEKVSELGWQNEKRILKKSISGIRKVTGRNPVGYRAPWFDFSKHSLGLLSELGYEYDSSLMNQDLPFFVKLPVSKAKPLVELPVDWSLDDYPAFELHGKSPREVREIWQAEFDALYSEGSLSLDDAPRMHWKSVANHHAARVHSTYANQGQSMVRVSRGSFEMVAVSARERSTNRTRILSKLKGAL